MTWLHNLLASRPDAFVRASYKELMRFDDETGRLEPINTPFGPKLSPMSPA